LPTSRPKHLELERQDGKAGAGTLQANPEHPEAHRVMKKAFARLTTEERWLCIRKQLGFSSREIAVEQRTSVTRVNTVFDRAKSRIQSALRGGPHGRTG
jgi:DNA-directed RNA polymerase specialized sigma24 family protein